MSGRDTLRVGKKCSRNTHYSHNVRAIFPVKTTLGRRDVCTMWSLPFVTHSQNTNWDAFRTRSVSCVLRFPAGRARHAMRAPRVARASPLFPGEAAEAARACHLTRTTVRSTLRARSLGRQPLTPPRHAAPWTLRFYTFATSTAGATGAGAAVARAWTGTATGAADEVVYSGVATG